MMNETTTKKGEIDMRWLTNKDIKYYNSREFGVPITIGDPKASAEYSVEQLKKWRIIGVYAVERETTTKRRITMKKRNDAMPAMNRIAEVARIRELEAKITQEGYGAPDSIWCDYSNNLRDAAPWLLSVAGQFQAGDADILQRMLIIFEQSAWDMKYRSQSDCLRRMLEAAKIMEAEI